MSHHRRYYINIKHLIVIVVCVIFSIVILISVLYDKNNEYYPVNQPSGDSSEISSIEQTVVSENSSKTSEAVANFSPVIDSITQTGQHGVAIVFSCDNNTAEYIIEKHLNNRWTKIGNTTNKYYYDTTSSNTDTEYRVGIQDEGKTVYSDACKIGYQARSTVSVACLMYHYFATSEDLNNGALNNDGTIMVDELESDLKYFHDNNIRTITCSELLDYINGKIVLPEKCVMISIDDGHYSIYEYLVPLLQKYDCKATVSIIGDFADKGNYRTEIPQNNYWMTWKEIEEISGLDCIEIGSHTDMLHQINTVTGRKGTRILEGESLQDYTLFITDDDVSIRQKLSACGIEPKFFAFPYNDPCAQAKIIYADNLGYKLLMVGDSDYFVKEKANVYVYGIGDSCMETRLIRRIARHKGDDIGALMNSIYNNTEYKQN